MDRVWIYQSNRELSPQETDRLMDHMGSFIDQWKAHGKPLQAGVEIKFNRFVIIRLNEAFAKATGCSIDRSVRELKEIQETLGVDFFDRMKIAYRDNGTLKVVSRKEFSEQIEKGEVNANTIVFNNMVDNDTDFATRWEVPLKDSWHARVFKIQGI